MKEMKEMGTQYDHDDNKEYPQYFMTAKQLAEHFGFEKCNVGQYGIFLWKKKE